MTRGKIIVGKTGPLQTSSMPVVRALMRKGESSGRGESPDVDSPITQVSIKAPKVQALLASQKKPGSKRER